MIFSDLPKKDGFYFMLTDAKIMVVESDRINECIDYINSSNITNINIESQFYKLNDLNFLSKCPNIESISIGRRNIDNFEGLLHLKRIRALSLNEPNFKIDMSRLHNVEEFWAFWNKNILNLGECKSINKLKLWKYKPSGKDLTEFSGLDKLEELTLTQASIASLKGCGSLPVLKKLELNYLRNFEIIDELENNKESLEELVFESCPKIKNHPYVSCLAKLKCLKFVRCAEMQSIAFIKDMPMLDDFIFVDTNVVDGDLSPCFSLKYAGFMDKRHYSHKSKDFERKNL